MKPTPATTTSLITLPLPEPDTPPQAKTRNSVLVIIGVMCTMPIVLIITVFLVYRFRRRRLSPLQEVSFCGDNMVRPPTIGDIGGRYSPMPRSSSYIDDWRRRHTKSLSETSETGLFPLTPRQSEIRKDIYHLLSQMTDVTVREKGTGELVEIQERIGMLRDMEHSNWALHRTEELPFSVLEPR